MKLTGHYDRQAATDCKGISTEPGVKVAMGPDEIITRCRGTFVITDIQRGQ